MKTTTRRTETFNIDDKRLVAIYTTTTKNEHYDNSLWSVKYYNCIYITFKKSDFPDLEYPGLVDCDWTHRKGKRFEYNSGSLAQLVWHCGITYYKEEQDVETGEIIITAGADYQHLNDGIYMSSDCGEYILNAESDRLFSQFKGLLKPHVAKSTTSE